MEKCGLPDGIEAKIEIDGETYDIDPCVYEDETAWHNVTVIVRRCKKCGHIDVVWERQGDTWSEDLKKE